MEVKKQRSLEVCIPYDIVQRYSCLPPDFSNFLKSVESISNKNRTAWFLCEKDYSQDESSSYSFAWNEPEHRSLDIAQGDTVLTKDIKSWWDKRLPIAFVDSDSGCEYYALDYETGNVLHGKEPCLEDTSTVASSFNDFLLKIISGKIIL